MSKLSIIVPVFNEERLLPEVIDKLMASSCPIEREWIFIDDCSTDNSLRLLHQASERYGFKVIEQKPNRGKGAAVIRGIAECTGDLIMIQDADFEYDPNDVPALLEPLLENRADVVFGSRFKKSGTQVHRTYLTDMETCYKIFRADLLKSMKLESKRFGIEVELTAKMAKARARVYELPISYFPRTRLQGKKINWKDGVAALGHLVRFNLLTDRDSAFDNLPDKYR